MGSCVVAKNPLNNLPLERTSPAAFQPPTDTNVPARSQPSNNIYRQATNTQKRKIKSLPRLQVQNLPTRPTNSIQDLKNRQYVQFKILPVDKHVQCGICSEMTTQTYKPFKLKCGHIFHQSCLVQSYQPRILQRLILMLCPNVDCKIQAGYQFLKAILPQKSFDLYDKILLDNALLVDTSIFFCPTPDCSASYEIIPSQYRRLICVNCKKHYCINCREQYHLTMPCPAETVQELGEYSRKCPQCKSNWFKILGCNHVDCNVCQIKFCYKCGGLNCGSYSCVKQVKK